MRRHPVIALSWLSPDVFELVVERQGLRFCPGDCVAIGGPDGQTRPYSLASGADEDCLRLLIRRLPDGCVSSYLSQRQPGDEIDVSPPFGWFRPGPIGADRPFAFVATGTGIAPFLSYLRTAPKRPPECILYGVRQLQDAVSLDVLERSGTEFFVAVSRETATHHYHGRVTALLEHLPLAPRTHYFLCGLDAMIDEVSTWLESRGVDFTCIHREVFFHAS